MWDKDLMKDEPKKKHCPICGKYMKKRVNVYFYVDEFSCPKGHVIIIGQGKPISREHNRR